MCLAPSAQTPSTGSQTWLVTASLLLQVAAQVAPTPTVTPLTCSAMPRVSCSATLHGLSVRPCHLPDLQRYALGILRIYPQQPHSHGPVTSLTCRAASALLVLQLCPFSFPTCRAMPCAFCTVTLQPCQLPALQRCLPCRFSQSWSCHLPALQSYAGMSALSAVTVVPCLPIALQASARSVAMCASLRSTMWRKSWRSCSPMWRT